MADILTFDNFFDNFPPKSGFATKMRKISEYTIVSEWPMAKLLSHKSLWKEWTSFTIQDVRRVLPRNFVHCFQRRFHICLGYETLSFLFLEQCFQLSLSDEIGGTFFDIDNLPIIWKMPIYRLSIICFHNIAHPYVHLRVRFWTAKSSKKSAFFRTKKSAFAKKKCFRKCFF